jgi:chemotaxis protein MotB
LTHKRKDDGEFLWLISFSDLMILLFVFFVVLFSFAQSKLEKSDARRIATAISGKGATAAPDPLDEIQRRLLKWVVNERVVDAVSINRKEDALILEIKEKLLFDSGDFRIKAQSKPMVKLMATALALVPAPYRIGIEGHTDETPVRRKGEIVDNWELSVRRALAVMKSLEMDQALESRAVILGYGPMRPLAPNFDDQGRPLAENQARNRRVTVRIF